MGANLSFGPTDLPLMCVLLKHAFCVGKRMKQNIEMPIKKKWKKVIFIIIRLGES